MVESSLVLALMTEAHSEPSHTSKMELFVKIVNGWKLKEQILYLQIRPLIEQSPGSFCNKGILKNSAKLTGEKLCRSFFFTKVSFYFIKKETLSQVEKRTRFSHHKVHKSFRKTNISYLLIHTSTITHKIFKTNSCFHVK